MSKPWLECVPWDGDEAKLPLGGKLPIPGMTPERFVKRWRVLDSESEEGYRTVKSADLSPGDVIIGAEMNKASLAIIAASYGPDFVRLRTAGNQLISWEEWRSQFNTDGLELWALRNKRKGSRQPFNVSTL